MRDTLQAAMSWRGWLRIGISPIFLAAAWGQAAQFDVVDVRPAQPLAAGTAQVLSSDGPELVQLNPNGISHVLARPFAESGTVTLRFYTMRDLITAAYKEVIRDEYIIVPAGSGPAWLDKDRFDLIAKTAPGTPVDAMRTMLQTALADRFHLEVHREQRPMTALVLTTGKAGAKLKTAAGTGIAECKGTPIDPDGVRHWACRNTTMADFADQLRGLAPAYIDQPVIDETGLKGAYDFEVGWAPRRRDPGGLPTVTIFDAVERLGLRLEETKRPRTVIVIDHIDRIPEAN